MHGVRQRGTVSNEGEQMMGEKKESGKPGREIGHQKKEPRWRGASAAH